ncbi:hypothetical protein [Bdellovibrio sp. BCCA]|uniref:hypothetical protein n=1 Tax=Bdellovibrio sp. BCCA TaxID=3136281 RepID=UPI0030F27408
MALIPKRIYVERSQITKAAFVAFFIGLVFCSLAIYFEMPEPSLVVTLFSLGLTSFYLGSALASYIFSRSGVFKVTVDDSEIVNSTEGDK